jgi:cysteinyl-tRNA synthetase
MPIRFTNTLGGKKEPFEPLDPPKVGMYACGPTVYDDAHVGHARQAIVFDIVRRHLMWRGFEVLYVSNLTDVDDKIIHRANHDGVDAAIIAERYGRRYLDAVRSLNVLPPDVVPRASGHIPEMIELIATLIRDEYAYPGEGSVYYSVERFDGYGKLSGRGLDELANRERVEPAPGKRHPLDFALWKAAKPDEPFWSSPWGPGRPGWHIECSAMSARYLGQPFDIHGGGADLIFPHHENEIAQSEAVGPKPFANVWLHNGHVNIAGEKMSKSLKNFVLIDEAVAEFGANVIRMFFCGAHYRSQMDYTPEGLEEAKAVWERFRSFLRVTPEKDVAADRTKELLTDFGEALDDDLNTPAAIAALHALVAAGHRAEIEPAETRAAVVRGLDVLGIAHEATDLQGDIVGPLVELLLAQREDARKSKDFGRADAIRDQLAAVGVQIEDSASGPRWFRS